MKKIYLPIVLMSVMALFFNASAQYTYSDGDGTPGNPYQIKSPDDLNGVRNYLHDENICFIVMQDIDLTDFLNNKGGDGWDVIGPNNDYMFKGTLDGNGKTISNLKYTGGGGGFGLFGRLSTPGVIKNLTIDNATIQAGSWSGVLVATNGTWEYTGGTILNCVVKNSTITGETCVGGIVGVNGATVENSSVINVIVSGTQDSVGGLVGENNATVENSIASNVSVSSTQKSVGGLVGKNGSATSLIKDCYVSGSVSGVDEVGGLTGINSGTIRDCTAADVTVSGTGTGDENTHLATGGLVGRNNRIIENSSAIDADVSAAHKSVGGLVGENNGEASLIKSCYSSGSVSGTENVGGLVGLHAGGAVNPIENCYSFAYVYGGRNVGGLIGYCNKAVKNCFASGDVEGISAGGLIGNPLTADIENCYATGNVLGVDGQDSFNGGLVGAAYGDGSVDSYYCNFTNCYFNGTLEGKSQDRAITGRAIRLNFTNCYFNSTSAGCTTGYQDNESSTGTIAALTDTEMKQAANFTGLLNDANWTIWDGNSAPYFTYQSAPPVLTTVKTNIISGTYLNEPESINIYVDNAEVEISTLKIESGTWEATIASGKIAVGKSVNVILKESGKAYSYPVRGTAEVGILSLSNQDGLYLKSGNTLSLSGITRTDGNSAAIAFSTEDADIEISGTNLTVKSGVTITTPREATIKAVSLGEETTFNILVLPAVITISSTAELDLMTTYPMADFVLANNLDMSAATNFSGLCSENAPFTGTFNGNGYVISGLAFNNATTDNIALFSYTKNAAIQNLGLENIAFTGGDNVAGMIGVANGGIIKKCYVANSSISGNNCSAGLVGRAKGGLLVEDCFVDATITAQGQEAGGIVGANFDASSGEGGKVTIENCYFAGQITGGVYNGAMLGLLASDDDVTIINCFNLASQLTGSSSKRIASVNGKNSYAKFTDNYSVSTTIDGNGNTFTEGDATGENGANIPDGDRYAGFSHFYKELNWDFDNTWTFISGNDYPVLIDKSIAVWLGSTDNDWTKSGNWLNGNTPTANTAVVIPAGKTYYPELSGDVTVKSVFFEPGAELAGQNHLKIATGGKATVNLDLSKNGRWHMLSMPIATTVNNFFFENDTPEESAPWCWLLKFEPNGADAGWDFIQGRGTPLSIGEGFAVSVESEDENRITWSKEYGYPVKVVGDLYSTSAFETSLDFGKEGDEYFALVGNPFMTSIDFAALQTNPTNASKIKKNYLVWTKEGEYEGFKGYADGDPFGIQLAEGADDLDAFIAPLQAFFVEKKADSDNKLSFDLGSISNVGKGTLKSVVSDDYGKLDIIAENGTVPVKTFISGKKETESARKLKNGCGEIPDIYTLSENGETAFGAQIIQAGNNTIPLGIATSYEGNMSLTFSGISSYDDVNIQLIDNIKQETIPLTGDSYRYNFEYTPPAKDGKAVADESRFYIVFSPENVTGTENPENESATAYIRNGMLHVAASSTNPVRQVAVYDIQGHLLHIKNNPDAPVYVTALPTGTADVYIIKITTDKSVKNVKLTNK